MAVYAAAGVGKFCIHYGDGRVLHKIPDIVTPYALIHLPLFRMNMNINNIVI